MGFDNLNWDFNYHGFWRRVSSKKAQLVEFTIGCKEKHSDGKENNWMNYSEHAQLDISRTEMLTGRE